MLKVFASIFAAIIFCLVFDVKEWGVRTCLAIAIYFFPGAFFFVVVSLCIGATQQQNSK